MRPPARQLASAINADYAREMFGLFVDVPWSVWPGYEDSSEMERGIVWNYYRNTFFIRFAPTADWVCDDYHLTWEQLLDKAPCPVGSEHEVDSTRMIPQPRGHRPRDAVWDQRKAAWVDRTGRDYDPGTLSLSPRYSRRASRVALCTCGRDDTATIAIVHLSLCSAGQRRVQRAAAPAVRHRTTKLSGFKKGANRKCCLWVHAGIVRYDDTSALSGDLTLDLREKKWSGANL